MPLRPRTGGRITAQGHPRAIFHRAIERGNLLVAETVLREVGNPTLGELLELTALIAFKAPERHGRVAARWLLPVARAARPGDDRRGRPTQTTIRAFVATVTRCAICSEGRRPGDPFVCDHIIPRARGGSDDPSNWQGAHRSCNGRKGAGIGNSGAWMTR